MKKLSAWLKARSNQIRHFVASSPSQTAEAIRTVGIIGLVLTAAMLFGLAIDLSPAAQCHMGPDWEYAVTHPWGLAEKLFVSTVVGLMMGLIPGAVLALLGYAYITMRSESLAEIDDAAEFLVEYFEFLDRDKDGKIRDSDLLAEQFFCRTLIIKHRTEIGRVEVLPDGSATYSISLDDVRAFPGKMRQKAQKSEFCMIMWIVSCALVMFAYGTVALLGLGILANLAMYYWKLRRKVRLQRFLQREFERLDVDKDGMVDELEIIKVWSQLAESERPLLVKLTQRIGDFGHEFLRQDSTIRGVTRQEADCAVPKLASLIV